jgi:ComF family protein
VGGRFSFIRCRSLFAYSEPIRSLLTGFKFNGNLALLDTLATLVLEYKAGKLIHKPDLILPVPLHISRLRQRGFNQSLLLAKACFPDWQERIRVDGLWRNRPTVPQTTLSGKARRNNLKGAFVVKCNKTIKGRNVLLVDDVFTTGATLQECSAVLIAGGAASVEAFTLARVLKM